MRTIERTIVSALIYSADGKLLLVRQASDPRRPYAGRWGLPGGGSEEGEDQRTTLNREISEELSLDISAYPAELVCESAGEAEKTLRDTGERVWCKMKFYDYQLTITDRQAAEIKIKINDEQSAYRWLLPAEVKELELTPPSVELFTKLGYLEQ